ncbi:uncharacterized protein si:ch211-57n23.1 [Corythoichthys intestinalis]|uniref:uncharacterized protein si:ch211-57n23.1 n=1 Tax=Corythoichthys intestinalis TaxID=161448 RepID=UPI0025A5B9C6|nr:uncharacterized protein si:ch211-57n23.1 [Corythoichthys intestinalis]
MLWWSLSWTWLLLGFLTHSPFQDVFGDQDDWTDDDWGSGESPLYSFLADGSSETMARTPVNCTQRFLLPSPQICQENEAQPEELARSRLLALQNRAALEAVTSSCGVDEGGLSYQLQASEEVRGVVSDHRSVAESLDAMEMVFVSLEEKRKGGKDRGVLASIKEHLAQTKASALARGHLASSLEKSFSDLEENLLHMQLRLHQLSRQ